MTAQFFAALDATDGTDDRARTAAAIALAHSGDPAVPAAIAARLATADATALQRLAVALEILGDPATAGPLLARIATAPDTAVHWLHTALIRVTGHDPVLPLGTGEDQPASLRRAWAVWDATAGPRPRGTDVRITGGRRATFVVADGLGLIGIGYDLPGPGGTWLRWGKSLTVARERLYGLQSDCGTCQTILHLVGWPGRPAAMLAEAIRERVADVRAVGAELLDALRPVLTGLRSGHYVAALVDAGIEHVTEPERSWLWRRHEDRTPADPDDPHDPDDFELSWPGTAHFQCRERIPGPVPTYGVFLPSQPVSALDGRTVAAHAARIAAGERPAALVTAWIEDRWVECEWPERFLAGVVLDGHHKLAAYAAAGVPARMLLLCHVEDQWGPPPERTGYLDDALGALHASFIGTDAAASANPPPAIESFGS